MKTILAIISLSFVLAGCTSQHPLAYRNSGGVNPQEEILYLHPFLALTKFTMVDQIGIHTTKVANASLVIDENGRERYLHLENRTNMVYELVRSEWQESDVAGFLPDRLGTPFVRDVNAIGWDPSIPVIFGYGRNPSAYSTNWLADLPLRQFFVLSHDRIEFFGRSDTNTFEMLSGIVDDSSEWDVWDPLHEEWGISTNQVVPTADAFDSWKRMTEKNRK
jgi:hypothetical protein